MDQSALMQGVQGVWASLDKLQTEDPAQYKAVVAESLAWGQASASLPEPALCLQLTTRRGLHVWCNLVAWHRLRAPDFSLATPSLPLCGGASHLSLQRTVYSVALHPSVLQVQGQLVSGEDLANIVGLVVKFLEQQNPGLDLVEGYKVERGSAYLGDLVKVREGLQGAGGKEQGGLLTASPSSLISQLSEVCQKEDEEGTLLPLKTEKPAKPLIQEIKPCESKKKASFGSNLQKAFGPLNDKKETKLDEIKIRNEECFIKEVQTRKLIR